MQSLFAGSRPGAPLEDLGPSTRAQPVWSILPKPRRQVVDVELMDSGGTTKDAPVRGAIPKRVTVLR
jgi:hypothetical protein